MFNKPKKQWIILDISITQVFFCKLGLMPFGKEL